MGSSNVEESASIEEVQTSDRPNFYPCCACGEKFTFRALNVHRKKCRENDTCNCICCSHKAKRRKLNPEFKNVQEVCTQPINPPQNVTMLQNISPNPNVLISAGNLKKFFLIPTNINGILKPVTFTYSKTATKGSELLNGGTKPNGGSERVISAIQYNPSVSNGSEKVADTSENLVLGKEKNAAVKTCKRNKDKNGIPLKKIFHSNGEQCKRKMFCSVCNNHIYWGTYGSHIIEHCKVVNEKPVCPICSVASASKANFLMHYYEHYSTHPASCPECKCTDEECQTPFNKLEHSYASRTSNICFICRDLFTHFQSLINHMRLHSSENPFQCTECSRKFRQVGNLTRHMGTHKGLRPHKCSICNKAFADPATLRNHVRTHTKETPYTCPICSRGFTQIGNLKRHKVVHDQHFVQCTSLPVSEPSEESVDDPTANGDSSAVDDPTLKRVSKNLPKKTKHPYENTWECKKCGKKFAWSYDLETHYRVHSGVKPYQCDICKKRFAQSGAVRMHKLRHHSGTEVSQDHVAGSTAASTNTTVAGCTEDSSSTIFADNTEDSINTIITGSTEDSVSTIITGNTEDSVSTIITGSTAVSTNTLVAGSTEDSVSTIITGSTEDSVSTIITGSTAVFTNTVVAGSTEDSTSTIFADSTEDSTSTIVAGSTVGVDSITAAVSLAMLQ